MKFIINLCVVLIKVLINEKQGFAMKLLKQGFAMKL